MESLNLAEGLEVPLFLLKITVIWQTKNSKPLYKLFGVLLHLFGVEMFVLGQLINAILCKSLLELSDVLSILFTYILVFMKSIRLITKTDEIVALSEDFKEVVELCESISEAPLENVKRRANQAKFLFKVLWGSCLVTVSSGGVLPLVTYLIDPNPPYKITYKTWAPFDYEHDLNWLIFVGLYEFFNPLFCCGCVAVFDMLPVFFFNVSAGLLEELSIQLGSFGKKKSETTEEEEIDGKKPRKCIELHLRIKALVHRTEKIFSPIIFAQGASSAIIICTTAFIVSKNSATSDFIVTVRLVTYMIPMVLEIFIPCYFANEVKLSSAELSTSLFHSEWIHQPKVFKSAMKMIMENNKNPIKVVAANGFFQVDLTSFLRLCNMAYSMYAVLQSTI